MALAKTRAQPGNPAIAGIAIAIAGAGLFSLKPILIKLAYAEGVDSTTLMALRMAFSLPIYLAIGAHALLQGAASGSSQGEALRRLWPRVALLGILGYYGASYLDLWGLTLVTAQFERLILFTYPTLVVVLARIVYGERLTRHALVALLLSYAGVAAVFGHDLRDLGPAVLSGTALVLGACLCFAGYVLFSKPLIDRLGSRLFTCLALSVASLAILLHYVIVHGVDLPQVSPTVLWLVLLIAVVATVLPSLLIGEAIHRIGPGPTSIVGSIGPVITSLLAVIVLDEAFSWAHVIGLGLVIGGVLYLSRGMAVRGS